MTVKELIAKLSQEDSDRLVVMSRDPEGNGFHELLDVARCTYDRKYDEVGGEPGEDDPDEYSFYETSAVCLWP